MCIARWCKLMKFFFHYLLVFCLFACVSLSCRVLPATVQHHSFQRRYSRCPGRPFRHIPHRSGIFGIFTNFEISRRNKNRVLWVWTKFGKRVCNDDMQDFVTTKHNFVGFAAVLLSAQTTMVTNKMQIHCICFDYLTISLIYMGQCTMHLLHHKAQISFLPVESGYWLPLN